jgi:cytoskeletal protein CcmA (bactofilin family)
VATAGEKATVLGQEAALSGRVVAQDLTVLGSFDGNLDVKGVLRIGPDGRVKAVVHASAVEIHGTFEGEIESNTLVFAETARAKGVFRASRLTIREGAHVDGGMNLPAEGAKAKTLHPIPPATHTTPAAAAAQSAPQTTTPQPAAAAPQPSTSATQPAATPEGAPSKPNSPHP